MLTVHYYNLVRIEHPGLIKDNFYPEVTADWAEVTCPKCQELYLRELDENDEQPKRGSTS